MAGLESQSLGAIVGEYWKIIAGLLVVCFGLMSLGMFPIELKSIDRLSSKLSTLANKGFVFGLALGGFATTCSASCNPIFPIILGRSFLQESILLSWFTLFVFAIGYSLPLAGILAGAGFGFDKFSDKILNKRKKLNQTFGVLLVFVGFGLLLDLV